MDLAGSTFLAKFEHSLSGRGCDCDACHELKMIKRKERAEKRSRLFNSRHSQALEFVSDKRNARNVAKVAKVLDGMTAKERYDLLRHVGILASAKERGM